MLQVRGGNAIRLDDTSSTTKNNRESNYYITAINTKRNPDLIIPGGAIKGNMYFRKHLTETSERDEPVTTSGFQTV